MGQFIMFLLLRGGSPEGAHVRGKSVDHFRLSNQEGFAREPLEAVLYGSVDGAMEDLRDLRQRSAHRCDRRASPGVHPGFPGVPPETMNLNGL